MHRYRSQRSHRCPDCHRPFFGADRVIAHRTEEQGDCFGRLNGHERGKVQSYRRVHDLTPSALPDPLPEFDPIDDGDHND